MLQQKRPWFILPRVDTRLVLKILIALNVFLAIYHLFSLQATSHKNTPCVVVINTSNQDKLNSETKANVERYPAKSEALGASNTEYKSFLEANTGNEVPVYATDAPAPWWTTEKRGSYSVINAYIIADNNNPPYDDVTLTTQGSFEFLYHAEPLCQRWDGPVSVAVYAPGDDFKISVQIINYLRRCRDPCVKSNVTWHFIFDTIYGPSLDNVTNPSSLNTKSIVNCSLNNDEILQVYKSNFRAAHKNPYPINVVRNVARSQSRTKYVLASDIELYPSLHVVSMFKDLKAREEANLVPLAKSDIPHTYVLPIFEVKAGLKPPLTKTDLVNMAKAGDAIFFHKWVCDQCQNFPDRDKWLSTLKSNSSLDVFRSTKRQRTRNAWEPLYIGTNDEPLYDERLTWDGKRDKMSQMYEMCLMNYDLLVLDNAFLVHAPGIKHIDAKDQKKRLPFIKRNNAVYNTILAKLRKKYGYKNNC
ncbi:Beta-1,4-glucuronyltransferase 1 [Halotydeus destructor]|nr:Beta-1,4-glucuronyltransferase 1 [Halotydeus destructor]